MPTSNVQICNLALGHLGQKAITSLSESSNNARKCSTFFESARDSVLRAAAWNFSTSERALALIDDETLLGWDYIYARPSNALFVRKVYNEYTLESKVGDEFKEFKASSGQLAIACDVENAYAEITVQVTDPNDFDENFIEALSFKLASFLAKPLTGDMKIEERMDTKYKLLIGEAQKINYSEGKPKNNNVSSYVSARG